MFLLEDKSKYIIVRTNCHVNNGYNLKKYVPFKLNKFAVWLKLVSSKLYVKCIYYFDTGSRYSKTPFLFFVPSRAMGKFSYLNKVISLTEERGAGKEAILSKFIIYCTTLPKNLIGDLRHFISIIFIVYQKQIEIHHWQTIIIWQNDIAIDDEFHTIVLSIITG